MHVKIAIVALVAATIGYVALKKSAELGSSEHLVHARLTDVRGIPNGAPVTIAGLAVGQVIQRRVGQGFAEIDIEFKEGIDLREDATLFKRRVSLLSGPSLEIDPGSSERPLPNNLITHVTETENIGEVLHEVSESLPAVRQLASDSVARIENLRTTITGPFQDRVMEIRDESESMHTAWHEGLASVDAMLRKGEQLDIDAQGAIQPKLDRAQELARYARAQLARGKEWTTSTAADTRQKVADTQINWTPYATPIETIDRGEGTLGTLLNNDEVHGDIVEVTQSVRDAMRVLARWQTKVGIRTDVYARQGRRGYITLKSGRSNSNYYYMEVSFSQQGNIPDVDVVYDPNVGNWRRGIVIRDEIRLTAQYARRFGPMTFRYGFKDSTFGFGVDYRIFDNRLFASADLFEFGYSQYPRLKVAATYRLLGQLYILAGLDDVLNDGRIYQTGPGPDVAEGLQDIYYGRDYFLGAHLEFDDRDFNNLLRVGGAIISGFSP